MGRSEDNFQDLILSFHCETQGFKLRPSDLHRKCLLPPRPLRWASFNIFCKYKHIISNNLLLNIFIYLKLFKNLRLHRSREPRRSMLPLLTGWAQANFFQQDNLISGQLLHLTPIPPRVGWWCLLPLSHPDAIHYRDS